MARGLPFGHNLDMAPTVSAKYRAGDLHEMLKIIFRQPDWLFHLLAPFYDHLIRPPQTDRLATLLNLSPNDYLLDIGGGTGRVSQHFTGPGARVMVCDINQSMLTQAIRKDGLMPILTDAACLPFVSETVDAILVVDALHHFPRPRQVVREMLRVLKPDGRLLIEEQDIDHFFIKLVRTAERIVGLHSHFLTGDEIWDLFPMKRYRLHFETGEFFTFRILAYKR